MLLMVVWICSAVEVEEAETIKFCLKKLFSYFIT